LVAEVPRRFGSITTRLERPVVSSICLATVTPSSTFSKRISPAYSVMIGRVSGSQLPSDWPARTLPPSCTVRVAPYGTLWRSRSRPLSSEIRISPLREMAMISPRALVTVRIVGANFATPFDFDSMELATAVRDAAPPMWNVRIVSCVPGSPIDCAAMTPTASPTFTRVPRPRSRP
jgi:hypothetical protein